MKSVNVRYFASLRERTGVEHEKVKTLGSTYRELYAELSTKYQFVLPAHMIQLAVNDEFANLDAPIENDVMIVFIPPVAGG